MPKFIKTPSNIKPTSRAQNHDHYGNLSNNSLKVGIIGGGTAGCTIAIRLAALGIDTILFENKASLIDGPPMCHLHAGGNLYREIPDKDCVALLKQSIDMVRLYPYSIDKRPTVICVPTRDSGDPKDLIPRLQMLTQAYTNLVNDDPANKVLGEPDDYYHIYDRETLERLIDKTVKPNIKDNKDLNTDDWVASAAKYLDLDKLKYPVIVVNEYGWNIFRLAASAQLALSAYPNAKVLLNTQVTNVQQATINTSELDTSHELDLANNQQTVWQINYSIHNQNNSSTNKLSPNQNTRTVSDLSSKEGCVTVDYLINACGFRTGVIDNMAGIPAKRMVEFKASYIAEWDKKNANKAHEHPLPEIIIHGERGTPNGMVQLTPYANDYFQIHSMRKEVTLFSDGLVANHANDAQPKLNPKYIKYINKGWEQTALYERSKKAVQQVSQFVPKFATAKPTNNALYGGQQIPGENNTLRVADISIYPEVNYARAENVKASSALIAADEVVSELESQGLVKLTEQHKKYRQHHQWAYLNNTTKAQIDSNSKRLAKLRQFPEPMAGLVVPYKR